MELPHSVAAPSVLYFAFPVVLVLVLAVLVYAFGFKSVTPPNFEGLEDDDRKRRPKQRGKTKKSLPSNGHITPTETPSTSKQSLAPKGTPAVGKQAGGSSNTKLGNNKPGIVEQAPNVKTDGSTSPAKTSKVTERMTKEKKPEKKPTVANKSDKSPVKVVSKGEKSLVKTTAKVAITEEQGGGEWTTALSRKKRSNRGKLEGEDSNEGMEDYPPIEKETTPPKPQRSKGVKKTTEGKGVSPKKTAITQVAPVEKEVAYENFKDSKVAPATGPVEQKELSQSAHVKPSQKGARGSSEEKEITPKKSKGGATKEIKQLSDGKNEAITLEEREVPTASLPARGKGVKGAREDLSGEVEEGQTSKKEKRKQVKEPVQVLDTAVRKSESNPQAKITADKAIKSVKTKTTEFELPLAVQGKTKEVDKKASSRSRSGSEGEKAPSLPSQSKTTDGGKSPKKKKNKETVNKNPDTAALKPSLQPNQSESTGASDIPKSLQAAVATDAKPGATDAQTRASKNVKSTHVVEGNAPETAQDEVGDWQQATNVKKRKKARRDS